MFPSLNDVRLQAYCLALLLCVSGCAWLPAARTELPGAGHFDGDLSLARLAERRSNPQRAREIYKAVLDQDPNNSMAHHRLAVMFAGDGIMEKSLEHFRLARQYSAKPSADLLGDLGFVEYLLGNLDAAEMALKQSLELDPKNERTLNNLGLVTGMRGNVQESFAYFKEAVGPAEAHANLAYVLTQAGKMDQATDHYHEALESDGNLRVAADALVQMQRDLPRKPARMPAREMQLATLPTGNPRPQLPQIRSAMIAQSTLPPPNAAQLDSLQSIPPQSSPTITAGMVSKPAQVAVAAVPANTMAAPSRNAIASSQQVAPATLSPNVNAERPNSSSYPVAQVASEMNVGASSQVATIGQANSEQSPTTMATPTSVQQAVHAQPRTSPASSTETIRPADQLRLGNSFEEPLSLRF